VDEVSLAEYVFKRLRTVQDQIGEQMTSGAIKNMEEYRFLMGELTALRALEDDIKEVLQRATGDVLDD
jgi:hypothetical protein